MNSWFLLFRNLCHNNVKENFYTSWKKNQGMAESTSAVGGGSRKFKPLIKSSEKFVLLPIIELLTVFLKFFLQFLKFFLTRNFIFKLVTCNS